MMDKNINNQCMDIFEKMSINLVHFKEMLRLTQQLKSKSLDTELELFKKMLEQRQHLMNEINQINQDILLIQNLIIQRIDLVAFNLELIQSYIAEDLYENLTTLYTLIKKVIMQIQELDSEYNNNVELLKEETKLFLHRTLRNIQPQQAYRQVRVQEARLIDKER